MPVNFIEVTDISVVDEARRQTEICNACRYCESYCAVFPALQQQRYASDADLVQLANLCHNCRNCYYACQFTAPHPFQHNLPNALAKLRSESWHWFAFPRFSQPLFQRYGTLTMLFLVFAFSGFMVMASWLNTTSGQQFYDIFPHELMVWLFAPAFLLPLLCLAVSLRRYWRAMGGGWLSVADMKEAIGSVASMKNLSSGHGQGCNFEDEDRYSQARRWAHQMIMWGFMLCFASTSVATIMHYALAMLAPYPLWSLPKLLGVPGGIALALGCMWMVKLKLQADKALSDPHTWGADMAFILLLAIVAVSGLALYALGNTIALAGLLFLHLGAVLTLFILTPYTKMAHGFYRLAALLKDAQNKRLRGE